MNIASQDSPSLDDLLIPTQELSMRPWDSLKFDCLDIPTMITGEEMRYLYWLGRNFWKDNGHIVEIGPWLGGSTACLASGMRHRIRHPERKCHVFDNFIWRDFMSARAGLPLNTGDSFQSYFQENLADFNDLLVVHRQALPEDDVPLDELANSIRSTGDEKKIEPLVWNTGEPVEILFIDGAKSWTGLAYLLRVFNEALIPGKSFLVCQDYKFWGSYWVPMMFEYFIEHFDMTHNLNHNTVSFRLTRGISESEFDKMPDYKYIGIENGIELLEAASQRLQNIGDRMGGLILQGCKVRFYLNMGNIDAAIHLFRKLEATWPIRFENHTINSMRAWLENETETIHAPSLYCHFCSKMRKIQRRMNRLID